MFEIFLLIYGCLFFSIVTCIWYIKKYEKYEVLESFQIYKHKVKNQLGHSMIFFLFDYNGQTNIWVVR
jgi:hypothetical protein